jgi:hypothetical protein
MQYHEMSSRAAIRLIDDNQSGKYYVTLIMLARADRRPAATPPSEIAYESLKKSGHHYI